MISSLTGGEIISKLRNLLYSDPAYVWGANGEEITPEFIQELKNRYVSRDHTPEYYDEKLSNFRGKMAVDSMGILNFLSGENLSLDDYLEKSPKICHAVDVNVNDVRALYSINKDHTPKIGVYLGNGKVIVASEGYPGMSEIPAEFDKWEMAFIPHFMNEEIIHNTVSRVVENYQRWLNDYAATYKFGGISGTGRYDIQTMTLSKLVAKTLYGRLFDSPMESTPEITMEEVVKENGRDIAHGYDVEDYACLMYILNMRLYVLGLFPEFVSVWGSQCVDISKDYGIRLSMFKIGIHRFMRSNRYLDSSKLSLSLIREIFT